jgi:hypothetical protein
LKSLLSQSLKPREQSFHATSKLAHLAAVQLSILKMTFLRAAVIPKTDGEKNTATDWLAIKKVIAVQSIIGSR